MLQIVNTYKQTVQRENTIMVKDKINNNTAWIQKL